MKRFHLGFYSYTCITLINAHT